MEANNKDRQLDMKRMLKSIAHRLWIVALAVVLGALLGFVIYKVYTGITNGETKYRISDDYYITFNYDEFVHANDFYNSYTWNQFLKDDLIVDYAMTLVSSDITRSELMDAVECELPSDVRVMNVYVTTTDPEKTLEIAEAYRQALPYFAEETDMLTSIELWTKGEPEVLEENTRGLNAAYLGAFIGLIASLFAVFYICAADDHIYNERDWLERYPEIPWIGHEGSDEYRANYDYILGDATNLETLSIADFTFSADRFRAMRERDGVILMLRTGRDASDTVDKVVNTLKKQNISIKAVIEI